MNGIITEIKGSNYIIPTINVRQIIRPEEAQEIQVKGKRRMIKLRNKVIPIINTTDIFRGEDIKGDLIVILELENKLRALPVDNIIGRKEIVVKPLGEAFSGLNFVAGASILGNGRVSLILDIEYLFKLEGVI